MPSTGTARAPALHADVKSAFSVLKIVRVGSLIGFAVVLVLALQFEPSTEMLVLAVLFGVVAIISWAKMPGTIAS